VEESCGLSWFVSALPAEKPGAASVRRIRHGGGTNGQISSFSVFLDHGLVLAILTNSVGGSELATAVEKWLMHHDECGLGLRAAPTAAEVNHAAVAAAAMGDIELSDYVGYYYNDESLACYRVTAPPESAGEGSDEHDKEASTAGGALKLSIHAQPWAHVAGWYDDDGEDEATTPEAEGDAAEQVVQMLGRDRAEKGISFVRSSGAGEGAGEVAFLRVGSRVLRRQLLPLVGSAKEMPRRPTRRRFARL
jgi:hypothetical protein